MQRGTCWNDFKEAKGGSIFATIVHQLLIWDSYLANHVTAATQVGFNLAQLFLRSHAFKLQFKFLNPSEFSHD